MTEKTNEAQKTAIECLMRNYLEYNNENEDTIFSCPNFEKQMPIIDAMYNTLGEHEVALNMLADTYSLILELRPEISQWFVGQVIKMNIQDFKPNERQTQLHQLIHNIILLNSDGYALLGVSDSYVNENSTMYVDIQYCSKHQENMPNPFVFHATINYYKMEQHLVDYSEQAIIDTCDHEGCHLQTTHKFKFDIENMTTWAMVQAYLNTNGDLFETLSLI